MVELIRNNPRTTKRDVPFMLNPTTNFSRTGPEYLVFAMSTKTAKAIRETTTARCYKLMAALGIASSQHSAWDWNTTHFLASQPRRVYQWLITFEKQATRACSAKRNSSSILARELRKRAPMNKPVH